MYQRQVYLKSMKERSPPSTPHHSRFGSGCNSPSKGSGYQTPRENKEEQWRTEAEAAKPGKAELREMYKELGGRKAKTKLKFGSPGIRDRGGWTENDDWAM